MTLAVGAHPPVAAIPAVGSLHHDHEHRLEFRYHDRPDPTHQAVQPHDLLTNSPRTERQQVFADALSFASRSQ